MQDYDQYRRIVIIGGPRCGKTTLSNRFIRPVWHTDDMMHDSLRMSAESVAAWFDWPSPWVIEGVTASLALNEWMRRHRYDRRAPCDCVLALWRPAQPLNAGQRDMMNYLRMRWTGLRGDLIGRGVEVRDVVVQKTYESAGG